MLINDLFDLNKGLSFNLWDVPNITAQPGVLNTHIVWPQKRNGVIRISEQEARVLYCNLLNQSSYYYSIETPTTMVYTQTGNTLLSANTDLSLYEYVGNKFNKIVNIEFKGPNSNGESIRKDIEKIIIEGITGNWFHTISNIDGGTLPSLFDKFINSFQIWFKINDGTIKNLQNKISNNKLENIKTLHHKGLSEKDLMVFLLQKEFDKEEIKMVMNYAHAFNKLPQDKEISILFCFCVLEKKWACIKHFDYKPSLHNFNTYVQDFFKLDYSIKSGIIQMVNPYGWSLFSVPFPLKKNKNSVV